jgi:hypothetical protein
MANYIYNRQVSWVLLRQVILLYVTYLLLYLPLVHATAQVGPVVDHSESTNDHEGQYIAGGYTGNGMPRAFGWYV